MEQQSSPLMKRMSSRLTNMQGLRRAMSNIRLRPTSLKQSAHHQAKSSMSETAEASLQQQQQPPSPRLVMRCGGSSLLGSKHTYNEDTICVEPTLLPDVGFAGVYDGHNGTLCSSFLQEGLCDATRQMLQKNIPVEDLMPAVFARMDREFLDLANAHFDDSGACAVACLVKGTNAIVAHAGDCCALLIDRFSDGIPVQRLTQDHTWRNALETERLLRNHGTTLQNNRLDGKLEPLRAFGDIKLKRKKMGLIAIPEICELQVTTQSCIILCSDGVTAHFTDEELAHNVREALKSHGDNPAKCSNSVLTEMSTTRHAYDDASLIVLVFDHL